MDSITHACLQHLIQCGLLGCKVLFLGQDGSLPRKVTPESMKQGARLGQDGVAQKANADLVTRCCLAEQRCAVKQRTVKDKLLSVRQHGKAVQRGWKVAKREGCDRHTVRVICLVMVLPDFKSQADVGTVETFTPENHHHRMVRWQNCADWVMPSDCGLCQHPLLSTLLHAKVPRGDLALPTSNIVQGTSAVRKSTFRRPQSLQR